MVDSGAELTTSALLIATSQTGDPGGVWNYYKVTVGATNLWGDFPTLSVNANWVAVSMNMFQIQRQQRYVNTNLYVFSKADLYASGGTGTHTVFADTQGEFTGANDIDNSSPDALYLLQSYATDVSPVAGQGVRISKITGTVLCPMSEASPRPRMNATVASSSIHSPALIMRETGGDRRIAV